jgi:hypothetical protein
MDTFDDDRFLTLGCPLHHLTEMEAGFGCRDRLELGLNGHDPSYLH